MKRELEIGGKVYTLIANRNVAEMINTCVKVDEEGNTKVEMPKKCEVFKALLKTSHPELNENDMDKLLEKADEEYGIGQMNNAIDMLFNSLFTSSSTEKKISWLNEETQTK